MSKWSRVNAAVSRFGFLPLFGIYLRGAKPFIAAAMKPKPQTRVEAA
jgi:hypothetical protein